MANQKKNHKSFSMKINAFSRSAFFWLLFWVVLLPIPTCLGEKVPVIASIYPVADMVRQVGGEHVEVTFILPPGASPHTFEPKPSTVRKFSSARIFFMIGAGLEFWSQKFVKIAGPELKTVVLSEGVSLIHTIEHHDDIEDHHDKTDVSDQASKVGNPHIWLDPAIAKLMVNKITAALSEVDDEHFTHYKQRAEMYLHALDSLDRQISKKIESFSIKKYVSFHASWIYFARRYGLEPVGVIEAAPGRNPTPMQTRTIVGLIRRHQIRAVFAEPQLNPKVAEVIAKEADVKMLILDPMGGPELKGRGSYIELMKYNLNVFQEAMR
jgi:zinc transport system substrate-binding protein